MSKVVLITPTRDRPEAFALCERYVERQTEQRFTWLVVDDGDMPAEVRDGGAYVRRDPSRLVNTLPQNLLAALDHPLLREPEGQRVLMIEDDEWYHPEYVEVMLAALEVGGIVGQANARYYHIGWRSWWCPSNQQHGSLCRTAWVHGPAEQAWVRAATEAALKEGDPFIDMRLWGRRDWGHKGLVVPQRHLLREHSHLTVGIKGMPGRAGLGSAHTGGNRWAQDPEGEQLEAWTSAADRDTYFAIEGVHTARPPQRTRVRRINGNPGRRGRTG